MKLAAAKRVRNCIDTQTIYNTIYVVSNDNTIHVYICNGCSLIFPRTRNSRNIRDKEGSNASKDNWFFT